MASIFDSDMFNGSIFFPRAARSRTPPGARDLLVTVASGVDLHLRLHSQLGTVATVLYFHGNGELVSDYDSLASTFARSVQVDLAVMDYRGYGQSGGAPSFRALLSDAAAVADRVRAELPGRTLIAFGRSLGSVCVAELAGQARPVFSAFVLESGIGDLVALLRRHRIASPDTLPEEDLRDFCPLRKLARCTRPTLVLHGAEDRLIPVEEARSAYNALQGPRSLTVIPDRGHNDISLHPAYWESLARFVQGVAPVR